jgi:H(+)-translocating pyrophosphatase
MVNYPLDSLTNVEIVAPGIAAGLFALLFVAYLWQQVTKYSTGSKAMTIIGQTVHEGAVAFLVAEYKVLAVFVVVVAACLCGVLYDESNKLQGVYTAANMVAGAILSAAAGYIGMSIATLANTRTCEASKGGLNAGLKVAFKSGSIMGLTVVAFGILGLALLFLIFASKKSYQETWQLLSGFGFGASSIALFARVGGGIYTKAADVGADLVGKVEANIPEDSPNNPATIADNVGDNVGDVAGMGADLFESYAGSIIAACTLATTEFGLMNNSNTMPNLVALPFWVSGLGIVCSIIGTFLVRTKDQDATDESKAVAILEGLLITIRNAIWGAGVLVAISAVVTVYVLLGLTDDIHYGQQMGDLETTQGWKIFMCILIGLVVGNVIGQFTEYCTSYTFMPTQSIARAAEYGPATVIIQGLGVGMISVCVPAIAICIAIIGCDECAGVYGVAIAAVGMLSTLGITLATDAYGPVADNAGGIAEMDPSCSEMVRDTTDALDALGNTTAATGKGFAIGSAVLTASALMSAFLNAVTPEGQTPMCVDLKNPLTVVGLLLGAMLPFIFAALTMLSVGKAAMAIIVEVRRQFKQKPWLVSEEVFEGEKACDSSECIRIATVSSIEEMLLPGGLAIFSPVIVGFVGGPSMLAGLLAGALTSGFMLAVTMSNAGGAWDNAKKWVEKGNLVLNGVTKGKNTDEHAAVVSGDTVGDPFKDTSGPALNVLIKLMTLVSLVLAPRFAKIYDTPKLQKSGFDETGVIIGAVIFIVVFPAMFCMQARFNARNDKARKAGLSKLYDNAPVGYTKTEGALA